MTDEEHLANGLSMLKQMIGENETEQLRKSWRNLSPDLEQLILTFVAGQIWTRSGLDLKTRSLCTIAALTALGRTSALELNIRMAVGNGASQKDIVEAMLQMAPYAGFPAVWEALRVAARVLAAPNT